MLQKSKPVLTVDTFMERLSCELNSAEFCGDNVQDITYVDSIVTNEQQKILTVALQDGSEFDIIIKAKR